MTANATSNGMSRDWPGLRYLVMLGAAASVAALMILVSGQMFQAAIILVLLWTILAIAAAIGSMDEALRSKVAATILVVWFATTPVAWYFVRFPWQKSVVTYERLVFGLVLLFAFVRLKASAASGVQKADREAGRRERKAERGVPDGEGAREFGTDEAPTATRYKGQRIAEARPGPITRFEAAWILLALLACFSAVALSSNTGFALRTAVDAFGLPVVAFFGARTYLTSAVHRRYIVVAAMLLGLLLLGTGGFEFLTGINLLPYEGSEIIREGEPRVNGPFISDTSFAIVSLLLVLFLRSAPRMFKLEFDASGRFLYALGIAAAALAGLLPLFRAVAITLGVCWAAEGILSALPGRRSALGSSIAAGSPGSGVAGVAPDKARGWLEPFFRPVLTVAIASVLLIAAVMVLAPSNIKDRLGSPRNAYGRILSWRLAAIIIYRNPVFGVGLSNYVDYFNQEYSGGRSSLELELDTHIVRHPHSNTIWIVTELGFAGLALYLAANVFLLIPALRAVRHGQDGRTRAAGACFIVLMAAYWIPGLEETSGMYSELNLYYFFLLGLIYPLLSSRAERLQVHSTKQT